MAENPSPQSHPPLSFATALRQFAAWGARRPWDLALLVALLGVLAYFFAGYDVFMSGTKSTLHWAWDAWQGENDLEHGPLILPAALLVVWMHREEIRAAPKQASWLGALPLLVGLVLFISAVRTGQARLAIAAFPFLAFGSVWFLWGWAVARHTLFASGLCLFMIPLGFLLHYTGPLQQLVASVVHGMCTLLGLGIDRDGVKLLASDGSFHCEVAGGCSGIRSLMAMTMLSAVYVHFTQKTLWKKVIIFACTLPFAVLGNIVRVFTIVLFAKFISASIGTGPYHDISGFLITIPIAVWAMVTLGNLLNRDWGSVARKALSPSPAPAPGKKAGPSTPSPISYDY